MWDVLRDDRREINYLELWNPYSRFDLEYELDLILYVRKEHREGLYIWTDWVMDSDGKFVDALMPVNTIPEDERMWAEGEPKAGSENKCVVVNNNASLVSVPCNNWAEKYRVYTYCCF